MRGQTSGAWIWAAFVRVEIQTWECKKRESPQQGRGFDWSSESEFCREYNTEMFTCGKHTSSNTDWLKFWSISHPWQCSGSLVKKTWQTFHSSTWWKTMNVMREGSKVHLINSPEVTCSPCLLTSQSIQKNNTRTDCHVRRFCDRCGKIVGWICVTGR